MRHAWLCWVCLLATGGCFSEPPDPTSGGTSRGSSGGTTELGTTGTQPGSTTSSSGSLGSSTSIGSSSTGPFDSTGSSSTSGTFDDSGTPTPGFCDEPLRAGNDVVACEDFDDSVGSTGWTALRASGMSREIVDTAALSLPNAMLLAFEDPSAAVNGRQALFQAEPGPLAPMEQFEASFGFRLPPPSAGLCGSNLPLRLFETQYGSDGALTNVVVEVTDGGLRAFLFSDGQAPQELFSNVTPADLGSGWRSVSLGLRRMQDDDYRFSYRFGDRVPTVFPLENFAPGNQMLSVNVGPWFSVGAGPPKGCNYTLDNLLLVRGPM